MAVLQVGKDGKAPAGAKVGDTIKTAGGDYKITGGTAGNWTSEKVSSGSGSSSSGTKTTSSGSSGGGSKTSSVAGISAGTTAQQRILDQMSSNSAAWHTADAATKALLSAENQRLAEQLRSTGMDMSYNSTTGTWSGGVNQLAPQPLVPVPTEQAAYRDPKLMGQSIGDIYGLTYDYSKILNLLNNATKASYDAQKQEFATTENQFYRTMVGNQEDTLNMLRQNQAKAVATGASKGIAAANELSAILGLQDTAAAGASDLANQRNLLMSKEGAAYEKNAADALETSNSLKTAIAGLDLSKYGYDVQNVIGILDFLAAKDSAAKTLEGVKYNADQNLAGTLAAQTFNNGARGSNAYYKGYTSNGGTYLKDGAKDATTPKGNKIVDGATMSWEKFKESGEAAYSPPGSNIVIYRQPDGRWSVDTADDVGENSNLVDADILKILQNNNDPNATAAGYGSEAFKTIMNTILGSGAITTGIPGSRLDAETGNSKPSKTTVGNVDYKLVTGTRLTFRAPSPNRGGTEAHSYTYNAAKAMWEGPNGAVSAAEMNKRLKSGSLTNVSIKQP